METVFTRTRHWPLCEPDESSPHRPSLFLWDPF